MLADAGGGGMLFRGAPEGDQGGAPGEGVLKACRQTCVWPLEAGGKDHHSGDLSAKVLATRQSI